MFIFLFVSVRVSDEQREGGSGGCKQRKLRPVLSGEITWGESCVQRGKLGKTSPEQVALEPRHAGGVTCYGVPASEGPMTRPQWDIHLPVSHCSPRQNLLSSSSSGLSPPSSNPGPNCCPPWPESLQGTPPRHTNCSCLTPAPHGPSPSGSLAL